MSAGDNPSSRKRTKAKAVHNDNTEDSFEEDIHSSSDEDSDEELPPGTVEKAAATKFAIEQFYENFFRHQRERAERQVAFVTIRVRIF